MRTNTLVFLLHCRLHRDHSTKLPHEGSEERCGRTCSVGGETGAAAVHFTRWSRALTGGPQGSVHPLWRLAVLVTTAHLSMSALQAEHVRAEDAVAGISRHWQGPQTGAPAVVGIGHALVQTCYSSSGGQLRRGASPTTQICPKAEVGGWYNKHNFRVHLTALLWFNYASNSCGGPKTLGTESAEPHALAAALQLTRPAGAQSGWVHAAPACHTEWRPGCGTLLPRSLGCCHLSLLVSQPAATTTVRGLAEHDGALQLNV